MTSPPDVMPKAFRIQVFRDEEWQELVRLEKNHQRLCRFPLGPGVEGVRFLLDKTWGAETSRIYAFYVG